MISSCACVFFSFSFSFFAGGALHLPVQRRQQQQQQYQNCHIKLLEEQDSKQLLDSWKNGKKYTKRFYLHFWEKMDHCLRFWVSNSEKNVFSFLASFFVRSCWRILALTISFIELNEWHGKPEMPRWEKNSMTTFSWTINGLHKWENHFTR